MTARGGQWVGRVLAGVVAAALLASAPASAQSVWGSAHTLMTAGGSRPVFGASDSRSRIQLLQLIDLHASDLGIDGLSLEVSGVAGAHLGDAPLVTPAEEGDRALGNLVVGRARWRSARGRLEVSLGRQYLFAGAGRAEHLDGLAVTVRGPLSIDATVFGGRTTPWQVDYDPDVNATSATSEHWALSNWAVGGRVRFRGLERLVALVGFIHESHDDQVVRTNLALDLGFWGARWLEALAGGVIDIEEGLPQELWLLVTSRPTARLKLALDYAYQVPALAIPKTSLFSVFVTDTFHELQAGAHYGVTDHLSIGLEAGARLEPNDDGMNPGGTARVSARWSPLQQTHVGLQVKLVAGDAEQLLQSRAFVTLARSPLGLYGSVEYHMFYLHADHGSSASVFQRQLEQAPVSHGGLALVGYRPWDWLAVQVGYSGFVTPQARADHRLLARVTLARGWELKR